MVSEGADVIRACMSQVRSLSEGYVPADGFVPGSRLTAAIWLQGKNRCVNDDGHAPCKRCAATGTPCVFETPLGKSFDEE